MARISTRRMWVYGLTAMWLAVFLGSVFVMTDMEKIGRFVGWQVAALGVAIVVGLTTTRLSKRLRRRDRMIGYAPLGISVMLTLAMAVLAVV